MPDAQNVHLGNGHTATGRLGDLDVRRAWLCQYVPGKRAGELMEPGADLTTTYKVAIGPAVAQKIPAGDPYWQKFNGSFKNMDVKQTDLASFICQGHTFTTWHKDNWRRSDNYTVGQHLGIDFDTEDKRSSVDHLLSDPFIAKYASLVYTTPSHTMEAPRARVVFLVDEPIHQAKNYVLAVSSLLWLFGSADRQCKDPCRFFYGSRPDGRIEWPANVLSLAIVKDMIARYKATGQQEKRTIQRYAPQTADEKKVQEALKYIPPWGIDYDQWLAVLMAVHSEFPGTNGLAMADSWAQGVTGEVKRKWQSFSREGNVSGRVSMGTLFALAKEHGYRATAA